MKSEAFFNKATEYFRYLVTDYGFEVTDRKVFPHFDNCKIVLSSSKCRLDILLDRGSVLVQICLIPISNTSSKKETLCWDLGIIVGFLLQSAGSEWPLWFYRSPDESLSYESRVEWQLRDTAERMKPYCEQILALFQDDIFLNRLGELQAFNKKRRDEVFKYLEGRRKSREKPNPINSS